MFGVLKITALNSTLVRFKVLVNRCIWSHCSRLCQNAPCSFLFVQFVHICASNQTFNPRCPQNFTSLGMHATWELTYLNRYLEDSWLAFSLKCQALYYIKLPIFHFLSKNPPGHFQSSHFCCIPRRGVQPKYKHVSQLQLIDTICWFSHCWHTHTWRHLKIIAYSGLKAALHASRNDKGQRRVYVQVLGLFHCSSLVSIP